MASDELEIRLVHYSYGKFNYLIDGTYKGSLFYRTEILENQKINIEDLELNLDGGTRGPSLIVQCRNNKIKIKYFPKSFKNFKGLIKTLRLEVNERSVSNFLERVGSEIEKRSLEGNKKSR